MLRVAVECSFSEMIICSLYKYMFQMTTFNVLAVTAVSYITASVFLFYNPHFLHKKNKYSNHLLNQSLEKNRVLNIAHRGGSRIRVQNTMECFEECFKRCKPDMLQMDVCFTKDKQLVVHHDHHLLRTCGIDRHIEQYNYHDLPPFKSQIQLDFAIHAKMKSRNQKIPLLQDVFKRFPDTLINVEIKTPSHQAIKEFDRLVRKYNRADNTIWGIRGKLHSTLTEVNNEIATFMDDRGVAKIVFYFLTGLLPFVRLGKQTMQIPLPSEQYRGWKNYQQPNQTFVRRYFGIVNFSYKYLYGPIISHLKRRGIISMAWVCNTEIDYKRSVDKGFLGIMTDDPHLLQQYLNKH